MANLPVTKTEIECWNVDAMNGADNNVVVDVGTFQLLKVWATQRVLQ